MLPAADILNDPVSKHCRRDSSTLHPNWSVGDSLEHMRKNPPGSRVVYFYVVDDLGKLIGVVPTRRLLFAPAEALIESLMIRNVMAIPESATVLEACEFFTLHRLLAFPVIDAERKLVGVIDVEFYAQELAADTGDDTGRFNDDVFELIGVHLTAAAGANPLKAAGNRFPWLVCNIAGGLLAAVLSGMYQDVLTWKDAVLAIFIPVVLALSESVAIQSLTLAVGRFRTAGANREGFVRSSFKEGMTGLMLGIASALLVAVVAAAWMQDFAVVGVLFGAIGLGVTGAAFIGFAVPTVLHRFRWNPQVAAGPVSLAAADVFTLMVYFNLALIWR